MFSGWPQMPKQRSVATIPTVGKRSPLIGKPCSPFFSLSFWSQFDQAVQMLICSIPEKLENCRTGKKLYSSKGQTGLPRANRRGNTTSTTSTTTSSVARLRSAFRAHEGEPFHAQEYVLFSTVGFERSLSLLDVYC